MAEPIVEQIAANVLSTLNGLVVTGPSLAAMPLATYTAVRPAQVWPPVNTGLILVMQEGRAIKVPLSQTPGMRVAWMQPFTLAAFIAAPDTGTVPVDTYLNEMFADVHNALLADYHRAGLAVDTLIDEPDYVHSSQGWSAVEINVLVHFRTLYTDAYHQS